MNTAKDAGSVTTFLVQKKAGDLISASFEGTHTATKLCLVVSAKRQIVVNILYVYGESGINYRKEIFL